MDPSKVHRISVKSVAPASLNLRRRFSEESACTMVFGRDAPLAPTAVRASRLTSTSCTVSWVPSNSNFMHAICVGRLEVKTVRPGVHRHTLAGLQPSTLYKIGIRAKNLKAAPHMVTSSGGAGGIGGGSSLHQLQNLSASIEVRTLPQGLPEPPMDVQAEPTSGHLQQDDDSITVSWFPVTISPSGTSNGAPVIGYDVYADGERVAQVNSGTADQVTVRLPQKSTRYHSITVRTRSTGDQSSRDSEPCPVPASVAERLMPVQHSNDAVGFLPAARPAPSTSREMVINYHQPMVSGPVAAVPAGSSGYPELDSDIGPSELSDIAEEPEEGLTDEDEDVDGDDEEGNVTPKIKASSSNPATSSSYLYNRPRPLWRTAAYQLNSPSQFTAQPLTGAAAAAPSSSSSSSTSTYIGNPQHAYRPPQQQQQQEQQQQQQHMKNGNGMTSTAMISIPSSSSSSSNVHVTANGNIVSSAPSSSAIIDGGNNNSSRISNGNVIDVTAIVHAGMNDNTQ